MATDKKVKAAAMSYRNKTPIEQELRQDGWVIGPHGKWWNPAHDDGSRYVANDRAFRYIAEDHHGDR